MLVAVLPARLESTRLPRKMLADIGGEPLIVHTWRRVLAAGVADKVVIATDSDEIADISAGFGATVVRTGPCPNGTVRVAEAAKSLGLSHRDCILNVQGDEPLVAMPTLRTIAFGVQDFGAEIATGSAELPASEAENPNRVKVVESLGRALYFSRSAIPHGGPFRVHVGVYAYTNAALQRIVAYPEHALERSEGLEQLRWLAYGEGIAVHAVASPAPSVDTAEDLAVVRQIVASAAARG